MSQIRNFDFTYSKEKCMAEFKTREEFVKKLKTIAKNWVFQEEKGTESGYIHYQGRLTLISKRRLTTFTKLASTLFPGIHVSATCTQNVMDLYYVTKEDTRVDGPWSDKDKEIFMPFQFDVKLRLWQEAVLQIAQYRDARTVNVIVDENGGLGKTTLAGYASAKFGYEFLCVHDTVDRMLASVCDCLMDTNNREPKCFFVDVPRSYRKFRMKALFVAIEQIKNGIVVDTRYRYRKWMFHAPCIWVFINFHVKLKYLSRDRWRFFEVVDDQLQKYSPLVTNDK